MEDKDKLDSLVSHVRQYAETRYDLFLINIQDKMSEVIASIASTILMSVFSIFILLFLSLGAAWLIGQETSNPAMGFFFIAGFYLLIVIIIFIAKDKWIKTPVINAILKKITIHEED